jgi:hypothetical protein
MYWDNFYIYIHIVGLILNYLTLKGKLTIKIYEGLTDDLFLVFVYKLGKEFIYIFHISEFLDLFSVSTLNFSYVLY